MQEMYRHHKDILIYLSLSCLFIWALIPDLAAREPARFGITGGVNLARQHWKYPLVNFDLPDKEFRTGFMAFATMEKPLTRHFSLKAEAGYLQKGFKDDIQFVSPEGPLPDVTNRDNVVLNNAALGAALKISPFQMKPLPYFIVGLRGEYMLSYTDIIYTEPGSGLKFGVHESQLTDFSRFSIGPVLGTGIELNNLLYLELEFNPGCTRRINDPGLNITDYAWGFKTGIYLNEIF